MSDALIRVLIERLDRLDGKLGETRDSAIRTEEAVKPLTELRPRVEALETYCAERRGQWKVITVVASAAATVLALVVDFAARKLFG